MDPLIVLGLDSGVADKKFHVASQGKWQEIDNGHGSQTCATL